MPSEKKPLITFSSASKRGCAWMAAAFFIPMLVWSIFVLSMLTGALPIMKFHPSWLIIWLLLALPCLLNASRAFAWQGSNKIGWIICALLGFGVLSIPASLLIYLQLAKWLNISF